MPFAGVYFQGRPVPSSPRLTHGQIPTPLCDSTFIPPTRGSDMIRWLFIFIWRLFD
ncbi:unnamed protein product [Hapterophycus canaliculatus]